MGKHYVVFVLVKWQGAFESNGHPLYLDFSKQCGHGFLPVYDTREEAEAAHPGYQVREITAGPLVDSHG